MSGYDPAQDPKMIAMFKEARALGKWFHCYYQDLWFSPDELEAENRAGRFRWGHHNWTLEDPKDLLVQAEEDLKAAQERLAELRQKIGGQNET